MHLTWLMQTGSTLRADAFISKSTLGVSTALYTVHCWWQSWVGTAINDNDSFHCKLSLLCNDQQLPMAFVATVVIGIQME